MYTGDTKWLTVTFVKFSCSSGVISTRLIKSLRRTKSVESLTIKDIVLFMKKC